MSRFLDQIRKARKARQSRDEGRQQADESTLDRSEEELLVPEKPGGAKDAGAGKRDTGVKREDLFPSGLDSERPGDAVEEEPVAAPSEAFLPEELESMSRRDDDGDAPVPEEPDAGDLMPEELGDQRAKMEEPELGDAEFRDLVPGELSDAREDDDEPEDDTEEWDEQEDETMPNISFSELFPDAYASQNSRDEEQERQEPEEPLIPPMPERSPEPEPEPEPEAIPVPELPPRREPERREREAREEPDAGVFPALAREANGDDGSDDVDEDELGEPLKPQSTLPERELTTGQTAQADGTVKRRRRRHRLTRDRTGGTSRVTLTGPDVDPGYVRRVAKVAPKPHKEVISFYDARHHVCEEYRLLGKNLLHTFANLPGNGGMLSDPNMGRTVTLTSSVRGEGKTLTCINLAMTLASDYSDRVLLIDGDLRHPKVHRYMGLPNNTGLNDLLAAPDPGAVMEDCIVRTDTGLHLLTSSATSTNPAPLLDSAEMTQLLQVLRTRYALVLIDTPPVLLATDALSLGVKSDGMLFLLRARKTQREQIQEARQRIARLDIRLLGYVMNNVKSFLPKIWNRHYYGNY